MTYRLFVLSLVLMYTHYSTSLDISILRNSSVGSYLKIDFIAGLCPNILLGSNEQFLKKKIVLKGPYLSSLSIVLKDIINEYKNVFWEIKGKVTESISEVKQDENISIVIRDFVFQTVSTYILKYETN